MGQSICMGAQSSVFFRPTQSGGAQDWVADAVVVRGHQMGGPNEIRYGQGIARDAELAATQFR
jgi:hypothetical protein